MNEKETNRLFEDTYHTSRGAALGYRNPHPLREETSVGEFDGFQVKVYSGERSIPHLHVFKGDPRSPTWHSCPRIDAVGYFKHRGKMDSLNSSERGMLVDFLKRPFGKSKKFIGSNWDMAVLLWNQNNPQWAISEDTPMPDYTQLP